MLLIVKHIVIFFCTAIVLLIVIGCSKQLPDEPVRPTITLNKQNIGYLDGQSCWFVADQEAGVCADPPHPDTFKKSIREKAVVADSEGVIRIRFPIKPDDFTLSVSDSNGREVSIGKLEQESYQLPKNPGYYQYRLSAVWEERNTASYHFGIQINK
ncbi:hypothetical protein [Paenibacillus montanisoli]|uniref:hypothetical protein n=1 Tax=Paenibacillus montanisoli TaxID=2081970 RepID=UPI001058250A|nr:hypothetical protein [Paenibacillus montanisoli]